ncbi:histidinol-phosphate transaminase [uncultured Helicobacter sp.]|uniref:histidinol-phosphate transaminase n=1 Tax=uncultured Helicobacter sp. TaxID=175537 RepID=UPI00374FB09B
MYFNPMLRDIASYEAGKPIELVVREYGIKREDIVKLASNENPYGTSPKVLQSIHLEDMSLYPDDSYYELKDGLAAHYGVDSQNIIIGSGSDQIIEFCIHALHKEGFKILHAGITFAMYGIYAKLYGAKVLKTPDNAHNLAQFLESYQTHKPDIIFLCVPNNPLGECLESKQIEDFLAHISPDTLVVIDGAYQEYAAYKDSARGIAPAHFIDKYPNVIYLGTFSKVYGLGGMRVGYGIAQKDIITALHKVRAPFNITTLSLQAAISALKDQEFIRSCIQKNFEQMTRYEEFATTNGIGFIPSYTNFITYHSEQIQSTKLCQWLLERGVIVRDLASYSLNALRITIGTQEQNTRVFALIQEYFSNN